MPERPTSRGGEKERVRISGNRQEVIGEHSDKKLRKADHPRSTGLRWPKFELAADVL